MTSGQDDPFNEELHGLRLYGWVSAYLGERGWLRRGAFFDHATLGSEETIGQAFEIQLNDDGIDLALPTSELPGT